jgi:predicted outer membrane repeat protein
VTNTKDSGAGSLRAAIEAANARAGADEIVFADGVGGTITLSSTLPTITDPEGLAIDGGGDVTVSGNHAVGVFFVAFGAKLDLRNLIVADGAGFVDEFSVLERGGGIKNQGTLEITAVTFAGNHAQHEGGAIYSSGRLSITKSTFSGNSAGNVNGGSGGAIHNTGFASVVTDSTFSGNSTTTLGGGIYNRGILGVTNSTFSGNHAEDAGGAVFHSPPFGFFDESELTLTNSTFSANSAASAGGAIYVYGGTDGTGITWLFSIRNTVVADSPNGGNCYFDPRLVFGFADDGYNVSDDGTCQFTEAAGSLSNTDPLLDPEGLQDNGGLTKTIALQPDSPAVDLVGEEACPPPETDQRGIERPQGDSCDSGAFELEQQAEPKTKAECKKGGHKEFGFKNQGQCIAFVNKAAHGR